LDKYRFILQEKGEIHLKTDSEFVHGYTLGLLQGLGFEIIYANHDIYTNEGSPKEVLDIQTFYEKQYLEKGKPITYLNFRVK
jgi:tRNA (guanine-N7-)-methyltransferase